MAIGSKMTKITLGVVIAGLLLGYVFPVGLNAINEDAQYDITVDEGVQTQVNGPLEVNVTNSAVESSATVQVTNTDTGDSATKTISSSSTSEFNIDGGEYVRVTVQNVDGGTSVTNTIGLLIETPTGFGWSGASQSIFSVIGLFLVLVPLVVIAKQAMDA